MTDSLEKFRTIDTADGHQTLIQSQWRDFASFAWRQYLERGRGVVIVDLKRAAEEGASTSQIPTYYVADSSEQVRSRGGWPTAEITEIVQEYDPKQDVIFLFIRLDGDVFHYNVSDDIAPPNA